MSNFGSPAKKYFIGWDTASSGKDSSVITVVELDGKIVKVVNIIELQKQNLVQQMAMFNSLKSHFKFQKIAIEKAGFGEGILDLLNEQGEPTITIKPTIDEKATIYTHLLKKMEAGEVIISSHPKLQSQLRLFRYELSKTGKLMLHHTTEQAGDDFCDSLAFAVWAAKQDNPLFFMMLDLRNKTD
jgi:hypothetical protein